jgi:hypothetical protein
MKRWWCDSGSDNVMPSATPVDADLMLSLYCNQKGCSGFVLGYKVFI